MSMFRANLEALEARFPLVSRGVEASQEASNTLLETARSGEATLRLCRPDGSPGPYLHSRVDPRRDGRRRSEDVSPRVGYVVVWGPGLFYEIEHLLERSELQAVLAIEPVMAMVRVALEARDLIPVLRDRRLQLLVGNAAEPSAAAQHVGSTYMPVLHGAFRVETARPRAEEAQPTTEAVQAAASGQLEDVSIQRRFGLRWFSNAVRNLVTVESRPVRLATHSQITIAAAGPSLEEALPLLEGPVPVISTDTALPVLLQRGIRPLAVVTLDCQQVSYHHLLAGGAEAREVPLIADLSSPPTLLRHARGSVLSAGGHPFAHLVQQRLTDIISVDGSGGNVTQAAVSFAAGLGAGKIFVVGADLSYPGGRPYARDCYVHPYFRSKETRLRPAHARLWDMVLADPQTKGERSHQSDAARTYRSPKLETYRRRLENYASSIDTEVVFAAPPVGAHSPPTGTKLFTLPDRALRREVLEETADELDALVFSSLTARQQALRYALLPSAAPFLEGDLDARKADQILEQSRRWAVGVMRRALDR